MKQTAKEMKIDNDYILDTVYDLADEMNMRIDDFKEELCDRFGRGYKDFDGLPEEIAEELKNARDYKKEKRANDRKEAEKEKTDEDIKLFRSIFPDADADSIPDRVWEDVADGIPLPYAYALFVASEQELTGYAENVNEKNSESGAGIGNDGNTEPAYTREQVEKMSGTDVKKNYKGILKAMKNWKFS